MNICRSWILFLTIMVLVPGGAFATEKGQADLIRIADGVYSYVGVPAGSPNNQFSANAGIVVGDAEVLVIDTLTSAKEAEHMLKDIRKITDKPIRYVVNTHYHLDHAFGNNVFDDMGAIIVAHKECRDHLIDAGSHILNSPEMFGLKPEFWEGTRIAPPDITFVREFSIDLGNMEVKLVHTGVPSHSAGSILVHVSDRGVLFTGDILFTDFHPYLGDASGDIQGWAETLDFIAAMDVEHIVPGHGPLSAKQDLADMKEYLAFFDAKAKELCATMSDPAQISAEMLKVLPKRADGAFIVGMNIGARYLKKTEDYTE